MIPMDAQGQAALITSLARRAHPSYELFLFSLLCGALLGLGHLLDSQAVLLLGLLLSPLMTPWAGFLLSILTGSVRFFFETFMALLISAVLVFLTGLLAGFAARLFLPITLTNVFIHARLWIPELIVVAVGAITLVASFVHSEAKPFLPSVIMGYAFFLPLNAAGFGLGSGVEGIWPQGSLVFLVHFALASLIGLLTLFALKLRASTGGMILSAITVVVILGILAVLMGSGFPATAEAEISPPTEPAALPTSIPSLVPAASSTPTNNSLPTINPSTSTVAAALTQAATTPSPVPLTLNVTLPPSQTPTVTLTIEPTPVYGKISASEGGGAFLRQTPNGKYILTLDNNTIVEILPDIREINGVPWVHVYATREGTRYEGWVLESVVLYATPVPNFEPSPTPPAMFTTAP
jgi:hypothetical protein